MSSITIASDSGCRGDHIAAQISGLLGYKCLGPELFQEAAQRYGFSEQKIRKAFFQPPGLFGMSQANRKRCIAFLQATLAGHLLEDKVVYHGPAGHFWITGISHVIRARITAALQYRVALTADDQGVSPQQARKILLGEDKQRRWWAKQLYNADDSNPDLYDLVIDVSRVDSDEAVAGLAEAARERKYQPMTYSLRRMEEVEISARVRAALVDLDPHVQVRSKEGAVSVRTTTSAGTSAKRRVEAMKQKARALAGVKSVDVEVVQDAIGGMADSMR